MKRSWHFPLINPRIHFSNAHYLWHIVLEIAEFIKERDPERKRKEAVDILHAAETFVRKYFQRTAGSSFEEVREDTVRKNQKRGYYQQ